MDPSLGEIGRLRKIGYEQPVYSFFLFINDLEAAANETTTGGANLNS